MEEGFLDRTRDRGLVVKSWAPQVEVLSWESVGGFVTHCGWNSILEAVCAGVPMLAWPLYAEQKLNKVVLVEEMKVAMPIEVAEEDGFVVATEVEKRVRALMDSDEGRELIQLSQRKLRNLSFVMVEGMVPVRLGNFLKMRVWRYGRSPTSTGIWPETLSPKSASSSSSSSSSSSPTSSSGDCFRLEVFSRFGNGYLQLTGEDDDILRCEQFPDFRDIRFPQSGYCSMGYYLVKFFSI